jgi:hypothetical protein
VLALALAPDGVERGVGAARQMEVVDHDPRWGAARFGIAWRYASSGSIETTSIAFLCRSGSERS